MSVYNSIGFINALFNNSLYKKCYYMVTDAPAAATAVIERRESNCSNE
jgi:hypothetical protein